MHFSPGETYSAHGKCKLVTISVLCGYVGTRQYKEALRMGEEILSRGRFQACIGA